MIDPYHHTSQFTLRTPSSPCFQVLVAEDRVVIGDDLFLFKDPSAQSKEEMAGDPMPADEAWQEYVSFSLTLSLTQYHSVSRPQALVLYSV